METCYRLTHVLQCAVFNSSIGPLSLDWSQPIGCNQAYVAFDSINSCRPIKKLTKQRTC